jgi:hypothetical protein
MTGFDVRTASLKEERDILKSHQFFAGQSK